MHTHSSGSPRGPFTMTTRLEQSAVERAKWAMTGPATATTRTISPTTIKLNCFTVRPPRRRAESNLEATPSPHLEDADRSPVDSESVPVPPVNGPGPSDIPNGGLLKRGRQGGPAAVTS